MEKTIASKGNETNIAEQLETSSLSKLAYGVSFIPILNIPLFIVIGLTALIVMSIKCQQGFYYLERGLKFLVLTNILAIPIYYLCWPHYHNDFNRVRGWCLGHKSNQDRCTKIGAWDGYYPNGNKAWEAYYLFGEQTSSTQWDDNGNIQWRLNGLFQEHVQEYYQNGRIRVEGNFTKHGRRPDGEWKAYSEDGNLTGVYEYKDGVLVKSKNLVPPSPSPQKSRR